jgi:hypothetical protein
LEETSVMSTWYNKFRLGMFPKKLVIYRFLRWMPLHIFKSSCDHTAPSHTFAPEDMAKF